MPIAEPRSASAALPSAARARPREAFHLPSATAALTAVPHSALCGQMQLRIPAADCVELEDASRRLTPTCYRTLLRGDPCRVLGSVGCSPQLGHHISARHSTEWRTSSTVSAEPESQGLTKLKPDRGLCSALFALLMAALCTSSCRGRNSHTGSARDVELLQEGLIARGYLISLLSCFSPELWGSLPFLFPFKQNFVSPELIPGLCTVMLHLDLQGLEGVRQLRSPRPSGVAEGASQAATHQHLQGPHTTA